MAINFPNNPSPDDTHSHNGLIWKWDGTTWNKQFTSGIEASSDPVGTIVLWSGAANAIPTGYQLCDGSASATAELQAIRANVPDLRDKFVVGAGNTYSVADTGGSADAVVVDHSHTGPSHNHTVNLNAAASGTGTTSPSSVPHTHSVAGTVGSGSGLQAGANYTGNYSPRNTGGDSGTSHQHSFNININATVAGNTGNDGTGSTSSDGVSGTNANLPPYYALCYIIKNAASTGGGGGIDLSNYVTKTGTTLDINYTGNSTHVSGGYWIVDAVGQIELKSDSYVETQGTRFDVRSVDDLTTYARIDSNGLNLYNGGIRDKDGNLGGSGQVLSSTGSKLEWVNPSSGGINLTDLSVGSEGTASGDGSIAYDDSTGVFTYTPPDLSGIPNASKIAQWDEAYGWGDHSTEGYLTSFSEADPTVPSHVKNITTQDITNWNHSHPYVKETDTTHTTVARSGTNSYFIINTESYFQCNPDAQCTFDVGLQFKVDAVGQIQLLSDQYFETQSTYVVFNSENNGETYARIDSNGLNLYTNGIKDKDGQLGTAGQILSSTGTSLDWIDAPSGGGGGGISLTDLSVTLQSSPSSGGGLAYDDTTGVFTFTPAAIFSGSYTDLSNKPTLFSGSYNDLTNKPSLFSGDYNDLSNKPTIPTDTNDYVDAASLSGTDLVIGRTGSLGDLTVDLSSLSGSSPDGNDYVTSATLSGTTLTLGFSNTSLNKTVDLGSIDTDTTYNVVSAGNAGLCPALPASAAGNFLKDDGTWGSIAGTFTDTNDYVDAASLSGTDLVIGRTGSLADITVNLSSISGGDIPSGTSMLFAQGSAPTGWTKSTTHDNKALRVVDGTGGGSGGNISFTSVFSTQSISAGASGSTDSDGGESINVSGTCSGNTGNSGNPTSTIYLNVVTDDHVMYSGEVASHRHYTGKKCGSYNSGYGLVDSGNATSSGEFWTDWTGSNQSHHHAIYLHPMGNHQHSGASFSGNYSGSGNSSDHTHSLSAVTFEDSVDLRVQYVDVIIASKD